MIVPIEVKGKPTSTVIDTGAQVTIINSQFYDTLNLSFPSDPVLLKGINLYMAPIEDQLLLGLDFMVHHKVDCLISQNVLVVDGHDEIPAIFKRNQSQGATQTETMGWVG